MMIVKWVEQTKRARRPAAGRRRTAGHVGGPQALLGGHVPATNDTKSAGPGFKAFRLLARGAAGALAPVPNAAIGGAADPAHAPFSAEQGKLTPDEFYARMGKLITPRA